MNDNVVISSNLNTLNEGVDLKELDSSQRDSLMESVRVATRDSISNTCTRVEGYNEGQEIFEVEYKSCDSNEEKKFFFRITPDLYYMCIRYGFYTELVSFGKERLDVCYSLKNNDVPNAKPITYLYSGHEALVLKNCKRIMEEWIEFIAA